MNRPQVEITNPDGGPRHTRTVVNGVDVTEFVTGIRWEHTALDGRPSVELEILAPAVRLLGDLTKVSVRALP
jgi:hypothetical protein